MTKDCTPENLDRALAIAWNTARRFPCGLECQGIDWEDLLAEARLAAWQALGSYDPARGSLGGWIMWRCRTAVQEALRRADPLTRDERDRLKAEQKSDPSARPPRVMISLDALCEEDEETGKEGDRLFATLGEPDPELETAPARLDAAATVARWEASLEIPLHVLLFKEVGLGGRSVPEVAKEIGYNYCYLSSVWKQIRDRLREEEEERRDAPCKSAIAPTVGV